MHESVSFQKTSGASFLAVLLLAGAAPALHAQAGPGDPPLGDGPWMYETSAPTTQIRVSVVARGIAHPWGIVFLPDGDILVAEQHGNLRVIRDGVLDPEPISGTPEVAVASTGGLMDLALHPDFGNNGLVYFLYVKGGESEDPNVEYWATTAVGAGRYDGEALRDVRDVFVANAWSDAAGGHGGRLLFAPDGTLFVSQPHRRSGERAQDTMDHAGKILRINDDGSVPDDNPFVGRAGYLPEIYSYGHRTVEGLKFHPETGRLWAHEHGPLGGDEINIILPGGNYGWGLVSYGRNYDGTRYSERAWVEGVEEPHLIWVPSIAPSGLLFYQGDKFPEWKGNVFVGALRVGRIQGTGHLQRIVFNRFGEQRRETLLADLRVRVRDVVEGPDGYIYVLTQHEDGALLKIEPVGTASAESGS